MVVGRNSPHSSALTVLQRTNSWRAGLLVFVVGCLILTVGLFCLRRLMGALGSPLPAALLLSTMALVVLAHGLLRSLALSLFPQPLRAAICWTPCLLLLLLAAALCLPGTSPATLVGVGLLLVCDLGMAATLQRGVINRWDWPSAIWSRFNAAPPPQGLGVNVSQQLTRRRISSSEERIDVVLRAPLSAGQRSENCHVAFCPPLASLPQVTCRQIDGPELRIKVGQVLTHGARIELRLAGPAEEECSVVLEVTARASAYPPRTQA